MLKKISHKRGDHWLTTKRRVVVVARQVVAAARQVVGNAWQVVVDAH